MELEISNILEAEMMIFNDVEKFKQILINLINNSVKFTYFGKIKVFIKQ